MTSQLKYLPSTTFLLLYMQFIGEWFQGWGSAFLYMAGCSLLCKPALLNWIKSLTPPVKLKVVNS